MTGTGTGKPGPTGNPATTTVSIVVPAPTTTAAATKKARPKVKLPTGGPKGPVEPPGTPAYQLLTKGGGECQELLAIIDASWVKGSNPADRAMVLLYRGAAEACLLQWDRAKADFDELQKLHPTFGSTCDADADNRPCDLCNQLALDWLTAQVAARTQDPTYDPVIVADTSGAPSPCASGTTTSTTVHR